jgi:hypothetical protein
MPSASASSVEIMCRGRATPSLCVTAKPSTSKEWDVDA